MIIFGVCGSSGSGKSTVCTYFAKKGIPVLDCDKIYHELISAPSDCLQALEREFGPEIIEGGALNRKKLAAIVFENKEARERLNAITHPFVIVEIEKRLSELREKDVPACAVDAPLLFESGFNKKCTVTIGVVSDSVLKIRRILNRENIGRENAEKRLRSQRSDEFLRGRCHRIIENNGSVAQLEKASELVLRKYGL